MNKLFDHLHPTIAGAALSTVLPWDHLTNFAWAVGGSVVSWAIVQGFSLVWKKTIGRVKP